MNFRKLKAKLIETLGSAEAGRFRTIGYQHQKTAASEIIGTLRSVVIYYNQSQFLKPSSQMLGSVQHEVQYKIDLRVSEAAAGDIAILNNVGSTPLQRAAALSSFQEATARADEAFDELAEIVYQILEDARNYDYGMDKGLISNRWISEIQKDPIESEGEYVVITGTMPLMCRLVETIEGDEGTPADTIDTTLIISDDEQTKAGKTIINTEEE